jgi:serine/threonine protein kinase
LTLTPGTRLGVYEITALLGAGGMGEVYRATDTNLKRSVAIKVLPKAVATDAARLTRFQREAEILAALNHPHIAQIYGVEDGALVMELVNGSTLADRIAMGAIPLSDALPIARQIADALEAAHDKGIVHRDLKPGNVKITPDGIVKVLDFGLAKATGPDGSTATSDLANSPTLTSPATQLGVILGTAPNAQMSARLSTLGFLDEFQAHTQSDHERHHDASPRVTGGERDARQDRQQDHQRVENRVPEQPAEARSLVSCQDVRPILSASSASVVIGQPFGTGRESRKDGRYVHHRRFNQDLRHLGVRQIVPDGGKELLRKNTRVDIEHAHLAVSPRFRAGLGSQRTRADVAGLDLSHLAQRIR